MSVDISNGRGDPYSVSGVVFSVFLDAIVHRLMPDRGPVAGGTLVKLFGRNFVNNGLTVCAIGASGRVRARFVSPTLVVCEAPALSYADGGDQSDRTTLWLSTTGEAGTFQPTGVSFLYQTGKTVIGTNPSVGPNDGGMDVAISGAGFTDKGPNFCRFGTTVVSALYVDDDAMTCKSPAHDSGAVPVQVSSNGQDFTDSDVVYVF